MDDAVAASLEKIGALLRDARLKAMLTQTEVGQLAGVSRQLVSRIEQGCNGEISAYLSVAAALQQRFSVIAEEAGAEPAGRDSTAAASLPLDYRAPRGKDARS